MLLSSRGPTVQLQWSHDLSVVECSLIARGERAITELQWSHDLSVVEWTAISEWASWGGSWLQWSHDLSVVECWHKPAIHCGG